MHKSIFPTTAVLLGTWLTAGVGHPGSGGGRRHGAGEPRPRLADANSSDEGIHGGTQPRICRTSQRELRGLPREGRGGKVVIHLIRDPRRPTQAGSYRSRRNSREATAFRSCATPTRKCTSWRPGPSTPTVRGARAHGVPCRPRHRRDDRVQGDGPLRGGTSFGYGVAFLDAPRRRLTPSTAAATPPATLHGSGSTWPRALGGQGRRHRVGVSPLLHLWFLGRAERGGHPPPGGDVRIETVGVAPTDPGRDPRHEVRLGRAACLPDSGPDALEYRAVDVETAVYGKPAQLYPNVRATPAATRSSTRAGWAAPLPGRPTTTGPRWLQPPPCWTPTSGTSPTNSLVSGSGVDADVPVDCRRHYIAAIPYALPARIQVWGAADAEGRAREC